MKIDQRLRPGQRRLVHHLAIPALALAGSGVVVLLLDSSDPRFLLSMASAYTALALLAATLLLGPWNVLRDRKNPVSTMLRRDLGIWGGAMALLHVVVGLQVHLRGSMERYFLFPPGEGVVPLRYDAFGLANWMGLAAAIVTIVLMSISNNRSLRRLGTSRWKRIQRLNYALFGLVVAHGVAYQLIEGRPLPWIGLLAATAVVVVALQLWGYRKVRREEGIRGGAAVAADERDLP